MRRPFAQVDVFTDTPYRGNPLAVVLDGSGLETADMQRFARWTNLSETTFVLPPSMPGADYAVRIFTPVEELPFAGHPTLGSCHAWLGAGGQPADPRAIGQECGAGLVTVRPVPGVGLAFAAPPLRREGPVDEPLLAEVAASLGLARADVVDASWAANGPEWIALLLRSADAVLALRPGTVTRDVGVVGFHPAGSPCAIEVRSFFPVNGATVEDPATGSLQASLAAWLLRTGRIEAPYVASQGTAIDRRARIHVERDDRGVIWVGGGVVTCVAGTVEL